MTQNAPWKCQYCGCTELKEGFQHKDGMMMPKRFTLGIVGSNIHHYFCKNCGVIVYSRVIDTSPFPPAGSTYGRR